MMIRLTGAEPADGTIYHAYESGWKIMAKVFTEA